MDGWMDGLRFYQFLVSRMDRIGTGRDGMGWDESVSGVRITE